MGTSIEESDEQFGDFQPEDGQEQENVEISKVLERELSETEEFKEDFDDVLAMSDDPKAALTEQAVQYVQASCDADEVNLVSYSKRNNGAIDGWGFKGDEEQTYVDLFITVYKDPSSGSKIPKSEIEKQFARLKDFFNGSTRTFLGIIGLSHPAVSDQAKKCADGQPY